MPYYMSDSQPGDQWMVVLFCFVPGGLNKLAKLRNSLVYSRVVDTHVNSLIWDVS